MRVIAGAAGGLPLVAPKRGAARPTTDRVKESMFAALGADKLVDASVLDLYAGSGSLAIEALSRGAACAVLVEREHSAIDAIRRNLTTTRLRGQARVQGSTVATFLHDLPPDYHSGLANRLGGVTIDSLLTAGRRHIHPASFVAVVVADAELVADDLERLGWATVEHVGEEVL